MTCPACGGANRPGRKFCSECGSPLAVACPSCGAANEPGERFCGECGTKLDVALPEVAPAAGPSAERRLVSVLFVDLVGFTSLSEDRDSEDVRELLSGYFDEARRVIGRFGGTVEKFIGDAVMAVWGTPVAREDDAERAVRAALDLVAAVAALGQEAWLAGLRARAAVLTGEAAVTLGAEGQGMVAGDLVNAASRVQSLAEPGTVLVGDGTRRASEAAIAYEDAGRHEVKGRAEPLQAWRALRVIAARRGEGRSVGLESPFVGRDAELRLVKELFHSAADEHKARLVSVVGLAGIGKSRLSWEFEKYLDGLVDNVWWHRGRCLSYGEGVTYWALAEMVRMRARIAEAEPPETALVKLRDALAEHVADEEERAWLEPRLAHLLGLTERTAPNREDLFSAWRVFFERLAERTPVVLVFEDLQWADSALLDFVEYLLEWSRAFPIFVLTLARPDLADRHPTWGAAKRDFTSLYLEPLHAAAMDELLQGLVPGLPAELRERIRERAEGIPLYAVETVRMLLDRGLVERTDDGYRPIGPVDALEVPETLHALIAARLDGLDPDERRVLADASVLGKTFTKEGLAAVGGSGTEELAPLLASLVRKEIFSLQGDIRSPERGHYGFLQALVQKVAHDTLSRRERKARHLAAAAYFETGWGSGEEEIVEVIAAHYLDAYAADPDADDAAEIRARARERLAQAGTHARSLAAPTDAQRYFDQAASLADDPLDEAGLLESAGALAFQAGRLAESIERLQRARDLFEAGGRTHPAARVSARLGRSLWHDHQIERAIDELQRSYDVLSEDESDEDLGTLTAELARVHFFGGNLDAAAMWVERALEIAERLGARTLLSEALNNKHLVLMGLGRFEEATALLEHALRIALEGDNWPTTTRAYFNLANVHSIRDRWADALATDREGFALARKLGGRQEELLFFQHLTFDLYATGEWAEVDALLAEMLDLAPDNRATLWTQFGHPKPLLDAARGNPLSLEDWERHAAAEGSGADRQLRAGDDVRRATILLSHGLAAEALEAALSGWRAQEVLGAHPYVKNSFEVAADAVLALGDMAAAERLIAEVGAMAPGLTPPSLRAQVARLEAHLAARRGEDDRVEPSFRAAADVFRELGMPYPLAVVELEHAEWLASSGRPDETAPLLAAATATFARLGARPALERAERLGPVQVASSA